MIFVDDRAVINMMRRTREIETFTVSCEDDRGCKLKILIEAMGHINFGHDQATDRKGLIVFEELGSDAVYKWTIYKIPVHDSAILGWDNTASSLTFPAIYKAELNLASVGDTYLDMSAYKKGYIYVNGHLLGRYWDLGPQKRVFCPGVWLNNGTNVVTVFELLEGGAQNIRGFDTLKE
jgi:beta-galactosidase